MLLALLSAAATLNAESVIFQEAGAINLTLTCNCSSLTIHVIAQLMAPALTNKCEPDYIKAFNGFAISKFICLLHGLSLAALTRSATFARSIMVLMSLLHSTKVRRRVLPEEWIKTKILYAAVQCSFIAAGLLKN